LRTVWRAFRKSFPFDGWNPAAYEQALKDEFDQLYMPMIGVWGQFPQCRAREGAVVTLEERSNGCMQRSMQGRVLSLDSSMGRLQRQNACTDRRQLPGNLRLRRTAWWGWEDSNLKPNDYQPPALSIEHSGAVS
jgi:hypothetical protein